MYDDVILYTAAKRPKVKCAILKLQKKTPNVSKIETKFIFAFA